MTKENEEQLSASTFPVDPMVVLDENGHIEMMNQAALDLVQDPIDSKFDRRAGNQVEDRYLWLAGALESLEDSPEARFEREVVTKDGVKQFQVRLSRLITPDGKQRGTAVTLEYLDRKKRLSASSLCDRSDLSSYSLVDEPTGLHNRRGFSLMASHLLKLADQSKRHLALLVCTVEETAGAGETNGKKESDRAVLAAADILRDTFRASDVIGRVGKRIFAVLAAGSFDGGAEELATRLRDAIDASRLRGRFADEMSISAELIPYDSVYPRTEDELLARIPGSV